MRRLTQALVLGASLATTGGALALDLPEACRKALGSVEALTNETGAAAAVETAIAAQIAKLDKPSWAPGYCRAVADNFASKAASLAEGVSFTAQTLVRIPVKADSVYVSRRTALR